MSAGERLGAKGRSDASLSHPMVRRFFAHRTALFGSGVLAVILAVVTLAPWVAPFPADAFASTHLVQRLLPPSAQFWFGTDQLGRDVFSRVLFGGRLSISLGLATVVVSGAIGTIAGLIAGYLRGWIDEVIMRIADIFLGIPSLVLAIVVALTLGGGLEMTAIAIAVATWPRFARLVRAEVMRIRVLEFVDAARSYGAPGWRILLNHIFPGTRPILVTQSTLFMAQAMLVVSALGFIGLGVRPPAPEWGLAISEGREYLPEAWWLSVFPGVFLFLTVLSLNFLGDGLRRALDPRAR